MVHKLLMRMNLVALCMRCISVAKHAAWLHGMIGLTNPPQICVDSIKIPECRILHCQCHTVEDDDEVHQELHVGVLHEAVENISTVSRPFSGC